MASSASLDILPSPLKDLVLGACTQTDAYGSNEKDKAEVTEWIQKVAKGDIAQPSSSKVMWIDSSRNRQQLTDVL